jgi:uncharacterized protein YdeI (YjbR/CyaY-like superfamily)
LAITSHCRSIPLPRPRQAAARADRRITRIANRTLLSSDAFQPKSRKAWREWLKKHHASSPGIWLVYAKKHTDIPSLSYNDAVEEALCYGWIDSLIHPIDDDLYKQMFTPRKPKSVWSASNKARVERLIATGSMTAAGMALITLAKKSGKWSALDHAASLTMPPELQKAIDANAAARKNWSQYSPGMRKGFLYRVASAKRPETRAARIADIVDTVARKVSRAALMERAGFRRKRPATKRAKT